jgi:malate/lactate dehydrogenase
VRLLLIAGQAAAGCRFPEEEGSSRASATRCWKLAGVSGPGCGAVEFWQKSVKVLVVGIPANMDTLKYATNLGAPNFSAMTCLDHNCGIGEFSAKLGTTPRNVRKAFIWGSHSNTQGPDASNAIFDSPESPKKVSDLLPVDDLQNDYVQKISTRGGAVIKARGQSSAASAANAALDAMRDWVFGTKAGKNVSMAIPVPASSPYGVKPGIVFSFPVYVDPTGAVHVIEGLPVSDWLQGKLNATEQELIAERDTAWEVLHLE